MSKLTKYLIVDVTNGKWDWNKETEHHSIAVPNVLNRLDARITVLLQQAAKEIENGMMISVPNRNQFTKQLFETIEDIKEEVELHFMMLGKFERKILEKIQYEPNNSPIMTLKKMDSPLKQRKTTLYHMNERLDNSEIVVKFVKARLDLEISTEILDDCKNVWESILALNIEFDPDDLLPKMRKISKLLDKITCLELHDSFFKIDDVTRGIIQKGITLKVNLIDVSNKLTDYILRTLIRGVNHYYKSEESEMVRKAFVRLKELKLDVEEDMNINVLSDIKILLEIQPLPEPSLETCYKKIGEMYSNLHSKIFTLKSLSYLEKYLEYDFSNVYQKFLKVHQNIKKYETINLTSETKTNERNNSELGVYVTVIENFLLEADIGNEYFYLSNKLHTIHNVIVSNYYTLDENDLFRCLEFIGSDFFISFIDSCEKLIFYLRKELKVEKEIDPTDLIKIGIVTGKTTMIDSYSNAIQVVLASLGTFMANTLNVLIRQMIQNLPKEEEELRGMLEKTYKRTEHALRNLNEESLSESF